MKGFVGKFTILTGAFLAYLRWAACAAPGVVLGGADMLWLCQRVFFGEVTHEENKSLQDVNVREILTLAPLIALCLWIGLYPKPFFERTEMATAKLVARLQGAVAEPGIRVGVPKRIAATSGPGATPAAPVPSPV